MISRGFAVRARVLSVVVAGSVLILGPVPSAAAEPVDGGTDLGVCESELVRPEIVDRDVQKKRDRDERSIDLLPAVYTPNNDDEDYRPVRGGLFDDGDESDSDERRSAKRTPEDRKRDAKRFDTNNLSVDGGLSLICR